MLAAAGWAVQDSSGANLAASRGVAVREFVLTPPHGRVDYLLFVDREAVGVVEAKKEGETLTGVEWQSGQVRRRAAGRDPGRARRRRCRSLYESTGVETRFTNTLDPDARSRDVFSFHRPETLAAWLDEIRRHPTAPTLRHRLQRAARRSTEQGLWPAQVTRDPQPRALARREPPARADPDGDRVGQDVHGRERRLPAGQARRRAARPVPRRPREPRPADAEGVPALHDARRRPQVHRAVQRPAPHLEPRSTRSRASTISTIQRLYSMLRGEPELDRGARRATPPTTLADRAGAGRLQPERSRPRRSTSSSSTSATARSTASGGRCSTTSTPSSIGLTATPNKQTFGFFNQNLVMEYSHEQAVADGVNVDFDVYRIRTEITERGGNDRRRARDRSSATARPAERAGRSSTTTSPTTPSAARPRGRRRGPDPHGASGRSATGCSPRSSPAAPRCRRR